ncbi:L-asparaginase 2 [Leminorella grimontii]|uniref:L-asparaginase 2 n=1 Tax=Leminorella grimontii TaxID=82981 RepID=A0AAV5N3Q9_9GAMM|nr:asparaginase [Leminorella grimontii]KFC93749.1 L-asparaginase [Leminorella grimontii ATCC 33999 = DSM 5078]GKX55553.1 L-asparaginase 2 [Leminorella grimontii]VFS55638.1 L-asparaginase precursor [Leminorella grimontii]
MKKALLSALLSGALVCAAAPALAAADVAKPNVTILATGGTIAGSSASNTDTTDYKAGSLGIDVLIKAVPEMSDVATVKGEQISNTISGNISSEILLTLSKRINGLLGSEGQQGVVVTHGTDTLEETAFFLDLTVKSDKPVVLVGAMRPATAISADGPMNLLEAVTLAADKKAQKRGVMVVLNDRIGSAFYTTKTNSTTIDTFKAYEPGYLGVFVSGKPKFYYTPAKPVDSAFFDVSKLDSLPAVEILYSYQDQLPAMLDAALKNGAKGIVVAGSGNGNVSSKMEEAIKQLSEKGIPVVMATRAGAGYVSSKSFAIGSGFLNPQKSRILLQLALASGADLKQIAGYFDSQR